MENVWTLVGLVLAVAVLLFLVFVIESEIHAKIEEIKSRFEQKKLNKMLDEELSKCLSRISSIGNELEQDNDEEDKNE